MPIRAKAMKTVNMKIKKERKKEKLMLGLNDLVCMHTYPQNKGMSAF